MWWFRGASTTRRAAMVSPSTPSMHNALSPTSLPLLSSRTPFPHPVSPFISHLSLERGPLTLALLQRIFYCI